MLRSKAVCLLLPTLLFTAPSNNSTLPQFKTEQSTEQFDGFEIGSYYENSKMKKFEEEAQKLIDEKEQKKREEELRKQQQEEERLRKQEEEKKSYIDFELTFYTFLECKNKWNAVTCHGDKPYQGIVASNVYPQGTRIYLEGWGEVLVWDRGGSHFNSPNRLDVFIDPLPGESESEYKARAFKMGHIFTKGYIKEK